MQYDQVEQDYGANGSEVRNILMKDKFIDLRVEQIDCILSQCVLDAWEEVIMKEDSKIRIPSLDLSKNTKYSQIVRENKERYMDYCR